MFVSKIYVTGWREKKEKVENEKLTLVKRSKERSIIFPIVIVNRFCDLRITRCTIRFCFDVTLYQRESYAASPIILL